MNYKPSNLMLVADTVDTYVELFDELAEEGLNELLLSISTITKGFGSSFYKKHRKASDEAFKAMGNLAATVKEQRCLKS